ncbi:hypothetical protein H5410_020972 [Solanum commersonii]|uniref:Replication factor A C-terminal domain-containing protein n=1 Tax=Solanum commersonii TaxID=4109 RepID=A0A9J5Z9L0_SOLCO|nr:hypothetical protein H5410_020972 [Solanum commersonii]
MEEAMFVNRMTVSELLDSDWSYDIKVSASIRHPTLSTIQKIKRPPFQIHMCCLYKYQECILMQQKIEPTKGVYTCLKCERKCDFLLLKYKIHIKVKDNGRKTTLDLFNGVAEKLLDTSAFKLLPSQIEALCGKEFVFKLKLSKYNLKEGLENYTVTKMYLPDEQLELQHRINKDKKVIYTTTTCPECRSSHTYDSKENVGDGDGTSSSNIKVYARKLKKRRKFLIDERDSDEDTNKNVNLKA